MDIIQKKCKPISKEELQGMREKIKEESRWKIISRVVIDFYNEVIKFSKTNDNTTFNFSVKNRQFYQEGGGCKFLDNNKEDIINTLEDIFVGCDIQINTFSKAGNGKMCDISKMDEDTLSLFDSKYNESRIVINWG
jgi:hypothetical protein